jgi:hypothetical protein
MNTILIGAIVVSFSCAEPHQNFRRFYEEHYHVQGSGHWAGSDGEILSAVLKRLADATADFQDYIVAYHEKCK